MNNKRLISIIIPVYNVEPYIKDCILSVLNQTYDNIEVIVVDDCTYDNSIEVLKKAISVNKKESKVRIIKHNENRGLSEARNTGIRESKGEYLFFLDSDDELPIDSIENLVCCIGDTHKDFVIGSTIVKGDNNLAVDEMKEYIALKNSQEVLNSNKDILNSFLALEWNVTAWNKLCHRSLFFDKDIWFEGRLHEDELWSFRLAMEANSMALCNNDTYIYKLRTIGSITSIRNYKSIESCIFIAKKMTDVAIQKNRLNKSIDYILLFRSAIFNHIFGLNSLDEQNRLWLLAFNETKVPKQHLDPRGVKLENKFNRRVFRKAPIRIWINFLLNYIKKY